VLQYPRTNEVIGMSKKAKAIFQRIGDQTQNPFWTLAMKHAAPVTVSSSRRDFIIARYGKLVEGTKMPSLEERKGIAFGIAIDVPLRMVRYVEGLVLHDGKIFQHAWVNVLGRNHDPISEQLYSGFNPRGWKIGRQYFAIAEEEFQAENEVPYFKHCMNMDWGIEFDEVGELLYNGNPIQNIIQQVYSPAKKKGIWLLEDGE